MNTNTGEIIKLKADEALSPDFVEVSSAVAKAQLVGRRAIDKKALRALRKRERQARRKGRK